jgi:glycine cleavage system aminomethyltransferase T
MVSPSSVQARTPLHAWHAAHGADFTTRDGWLLPAAYPALDTALALADVSAFVKISFLGRGVTALTRALVGDGPANHPRGVSMLSVAGPALACRLTDDHLLLLTSTTDLTAVERHLAPLRQLPAVVQADVTSAHAAFHLVGAAVDKVLSRLTALDMQPSALPLGCCAETGLAGVQALLVPAADYGRPGVRICVGWDLAEYVWGRLLEEGHPWKITALGLTALAAKREESAG